MFDSPQLFIIYLQTFIERLQMMDWQYPHYSKLRVK